MPRNGGLGQGISSGGDLPSSASRSPQLPPLYRPADAPRVQFVERTVDALSGRKDGQGRSPVGWGRRGRREEVGEIAEPHQFRLREEGERGQSVRLRFRSISEGLGSETRDALAGIRERPTGIRAEFWAQFPRPSKRWNSGPNSEIPNSWLNSVHPNGAYMLLHPTYHLLSGIIRGVNLH
jgi:hypothetical protein